MSEHSKEPEKDTHKAAIAEDVEADSQSDPGLDDGAGGEWADEGGAVEEGPATDQDAASS